MSQHDLILDDQSGANFLADLNLAIKAIASNALGNSRPATAYAGQFWVDADYDTNADALMYIVDPANASKDTVVAVIETSSGKWLAPGNKETVDVDCSAGGTITLSALEDAYGVVNLTGTPAADFNLVVSNRKLGRTINNSSGKTGTVKTAAGTGIGVATGATGVLVCDGTNVERELQLITTMAALGVLAPHENLRIANNATNSNYQMDIDADAIALTDTSGNQVKASSVNLTVDITVSGANGLDTGSEASSTWYHLWVISDGASVAGILSTSATAPTMPSGYTYKGYVGAIYNSAAGNFITIYQKNNIVSRNSVVDLTSGSSTSTVPVTLSIPPTANKASGYVEGTHTTGGVASTRIAPLSGYVAGNQIFSSRATGATYVKFESGFTISIYEPQTIYYAVSTGSLGGIVTTGWEY